MKKLRYIFIIVFVFQFFASNAQNEKFKALFIYNFAKNIAWQGEYSEGDFIIGVYGFSEIVNELENIAQKKKTNNQKIVIKRFKTIEEAEKCNILFIPRNKSNKIEEINTFFGNKQTLVISDKEGLKGADINFVDTEFNLEFEIYPEQIRNKQMKVSQVLIDLSKKK